MLTLGFFCGEHSTIDVRFFRLLDRYVTSFAYEKISYILNFMVVLFSVYRRRKRYGACFRLICENSTR